jgi:hypothetical protein
LAKKFHVAFCKISERAEMSAYFLMFGSSIVSAVSRLKCDTPIEVLHGKELQSFERGRARRDHGWQGTWRKRPAISGVARAFA